MTVAAREVQVEMASPEELRRELERLELRVQRIEAELQLRQEASTADPSPGSTAKSSFLGRMLERKQLAREALESQQAALQRDGADGAAAASPESAGLSSQSTSTSPESAAVPPLPPPMPTYATEMRPNPVEEAQAVAANEIESAERADVRGGAIEAAPLVFGTRIGARVPTATMPVESAEAQRDRLELKIGMHWMAWAGAMVVLLAVGLFVKLAYDSGWFGRLSPQVKCVACATFGVLLLAGGETALRKVSRPAAVSLFGAGLGTLYITAFATFRYFQLVSENVAFVLLALVAIVGFALSVRGRTLPIGVLSVVGGYLAPLLLNQAAGFPGSLCLYLTMLLGILLGLSTWLATPFRPLRYAALGAHGLVAGLWIVGPGQAEWGITLAFMGLWWALCVVEGISAARREQSANGNCATTLAATAWLAIFGAWVVADVSGGTRLLGALFGGLAVVCGAIGASFGGGLSVLRTQPATALAKLATTLWAQAGALLVIAVAYQFDGYGQQISWLAIALLGVEIGRRLPSRGVDVFGLIVGAIAVLRTISSYRFEEAAVWRAGDVVVTQWSIIALACVATMHAAAQRLRRDGNPPLETAPISLAALGTMAWAVLCAAQCGGVSITAGWLIAAAALVLLERFGRPQRYFEIGAGLLALAALRWLAIDCFSRRLSPAWDARSLTPVLNAQMAIAVAIAALLWRCGRVVSQRRLMGGEASEAPPRALQVIVLGIAGAFLAGLTFEIDRIVEVTAAGGQLLGFGAKHAKQLLFTLLWSGGALALTWVAMLLGARRAEVGAPMALIRSAALVLLAFCGVKWLVSDTLLMALLPVRATAEALPFANISLLAGALIAGGAWYWAYVARHESREAVASAVDSTGTLRVSELGGIEFAARFEVCALPVGCVLLLWGLSFEIDRLIGRLESSGWAHSWPGMQLRALWCTALWAGGAGGMIAWGRARAERVFLSFGWVILVAAAIAWLTVDTIAWRIGRDPAAVKPLLNEMTLIGAALIGLLAWARRGSETSADAGVAPIVVRLRPVAGAALSMIGLWIGTIEIDRYFATQPEGLLRSDRAVQAAFSVYWSLYGVAMVAAGFVWPQRVCRYAGLTLLAVALVKAVTVDMADVKGIYRILSLLGVGLIMMATSVSYAKLSARLLRPSPEHVVAENAA